ncbi:hypothetical protein Ccrd_025217 [Cynara cardunculus var. scolymus]|uniref:Glucose/ribitol dehydrogenase n=1 Tax=Cynara cardunculus var. scolymus TaxID=59895 RepID=A0A118JS71_CYNCS|nr:hypothetical protein Ccrd_025217 [Cynara cardunculus var. scolymus]
MMYSIASGIGGIPITEKSCMSSQRLLATRGTLRISSYGVVMNIGSLVVRRRCSAFPTLKGKVALVTGGDSGIGRAICYAFAKEGATIAFTYVKGDEDIDAADTLKIIKEAKTSESSDPTAIPTDLRYNQNCQDVVDDVIAKYGHIDVLINNPAVQYPLYSLEDITEERLEKVFRTNIFSYFFMTRHAIKHMKQGSSIINTASLVAYIGNGKFLDYGSTKGAVVSFTRGLSQFLLDKGIRVNGVAPGPVWTPLEVSGQDDEEIVIFGSQVPMDRAAQPYEMAPSR